MLFIPFILYMRVSVPTCALTHWFSLDVEGDALDSIHIIPWYGDALGIACPSQYVNEMLLRSE